MTSYSKAIQFLHDLQLFGANLGLETPRQLAALAGNPQNSLRFIHVAGTNGKGSTCAILDSIYRAAGLRVGLYTSPHLIAFGERIQINRQSSSPADIIHLVDQMRSLMATFPADRHPTFFEVVTVMALCHFADQKCDLVIWETGLGGRLDATNIVTPLASVITNIQFDHEKWLGDTLAKIAAEKAGIIKPGVPVITATDAPEALDVIRKTASGNQAPLTEITASRLSPLISNLSLLGSHQQLNAAIALATVRVLSAEIPVSDDAIREGLSTVRWPGRLQVIKTPTQMFLLDGAHNPAGAETLATGLRHHFPERPPTLILGAMKDKDWAKLCRILAPLASRIIVSSIASERSADPADLLSACREANPSATIESASSLRDALGKAIKDPFVVITGSLYFIGEALELLDATDNAAGQERSLNEWTAKPASPDRDSAAGRPE